MIDSGVSRDAQPGLCRCGHPPCSHHDGMGRRDDEACRVRTILDLDIGATVEECECPGFRPASLRQNVVRRARELWASCRRTTQRTVEDVEDVEDGI